MKISLSFVYHALLKGFAEHYLTGDTSSEPMRFPGSLRFYEKPGRHFFQRVRLFDNDISDDPDTLYIFMDSVPLWAQSLNGAILLRDKTASPDATDGSATVPDDLKECLFSVLEAEGMSSLTLLQSVTQIFEVCNQWELNAITKTMDGGGLQDLVDLSCKMLCNPLFIMDEGLTVKAISSSPEMEARDPNWHNQKENKAWLPETMLNTLTKTEEYQLSSSRYEALLFKPEFFPDPCCVKNIRQGKRLLGAIFEVQANQPIDRCDVEILDRIERFSAYIMERESGKLEAATGMYYEKILQRILDGELQDQPDALWAELAKLRWKKGNHFRVLCIDLPEKYQSEKFYYVVDTLFSSDLKGRMLFYNGFLFGVFSLKEVPQLENNMAYYLTELKGRAGVSEAFYDFEHLAWYFSQAQFALTCGMRQDFKGVIYPYARYAPYHAAQIMTAASGKQILGRQLSELAAFDFEHDTDYVYTLFVYLQNERNVAQTAKTMHLHRNSMLYRLRKIEDLMQTDFSDPNERFMTLLQLYGHYIDRPMI